MTETITRVEFNCATGEQVVVPLTEQELTQLEKDRAEAEALRLEREAALQAHAEAKASALAKLAALGLTEQEAKAIAG